MESVHNMSHHHTQRDASGRVISLLNEPNESPAHVPRSSYTAAQLYNQYASGGQRRDESYPGTPDLARSHSYDSQASGHDSPLTPSSAYHEPLFFSAKDPPTHLHTSEAHATILPPISSFHKVAGTMDARTATSPELSRCKSNPYGPVVGANLSTSSLDEFHYRASVDFRIAPVLPEPAIHRSVESADDPAYPELLLKEDGRAGREYRREHIDATKKSNKAKNGSQKRYPCKDPGCARTFTTSGHASRHAKIHEGLKPISCTFEGCPKRFTRQDNMKQHLETHRREKSRGAAKHNRRPSLATRRQSASSRGSVSGFSSPRVTPPMLSPNVQSMLSPSLSWARPPIASRTPSGLDALAMVAATEQATVEQEEANRHTEHFQYWRHLHH